MEIVVYNPALKSEWDELVLSSRNGTFLIQRDFMDYHSNRFQDHSLLFYTKSKLIAVLPGHIDNNTYFSHQGLTYGGFILAKKTTAIEIKEAIDDLKIYLSEKGITKLIYKSIPHIYHSYPTEEDLYALFQAGANITNRAIASTVNLENKLEFSRDRKRHAKRAISYKLSVSESDSFDEFWVILENNLKQMYEAKPVHSLEEIKLLKSRFPNQIRLFCTKNSDNKIVGGTVIFEMPNIVHAQYISANLEGKQTGSIDILFAHLIHNVYAEKKYFDFGISTEDGGRYLNEGLISQKEGFGGRGIVYDTYELLLT